MQCRLYVFNQAYDFARCIKVANSLRAGVISCEAMKFIYTVASGYRLRIACREMSTPRRTAAPRVPSPLRQVTTTTSDADDCLSTFIPRSPSDEQLMEILALIRQEEIEESAAGRVGDIDYCGSVTVVVPWWEFEIEALVEEEEDEEVL